MGLAEKSRSEEGALLVASGRSDLSTRAAKQKAAKQQPM
jgi:hypothetical protein